MFSRFANRFNPNTGRRTIALLLALCACGSAWSQVTAPNDALENLAIEDLFKLTVSAVSRHAQSLSDAPAAVTVITAEDIRKFGYRTLGDVIGSVKGAYVNDNRTYQYLGFRGFARAGDYNTRVLLLIDGDRVNDSVYDQATISGAFPLEMESVERVEFVPGPGSAMYGSNAFFAVINVVTRHEDSKPGSQAVIKVDNQNRWSVWGGHTNTFGERGRVSIDVAQRGGAGPSLYYPFYDAPATNYGRENGVDFEKAQRLTTKLSVAGFSVSLTHSDRSKGLSGAPFSVIFNDAASRYHDVFTLLDASHNLALSDQLDASVHGFWGDYRFDGAYAAIGAPSSHELAQSTRHGADAHLSWRGGGDHYVMAGFEYQRDSKVRQRSYDVDPYALYLDDNRPRHRYALFLQDEWRVGASVLTLGLRHDRAADAVPTNNPRLSLVLPFGSGYVFKSIYGTAFRAANAFEKYFALPVLVPTWKANSRLKPERIRNLDLILERSHGNWSGSLNAYTYRMTDLIQQRADPVDGSLVFDNIAGVYGRGMDAEVKHRWANGAALQMSISQQAAHETQTGARSVNSPSHLAKLRFSLPFFADGATVAVDLLGIARRLGTTENIPGHGNANLLLSGIRVAKGLDVGAGIYNLFNANILHPTGDHSFNGMQQDKRHLQLWVRGQL